jgi:hypothetical protein
VLEDIELTEEADDDLRRIGGRTEKLLIGELLGLPRVPRSRFERLPLNESGKPTRFRWRIGEFVVVFHERQRREAIVLNVAVVERVIRRRQLQEWLERESDRARRRDERIAREDAPAR